MRASGTAMVRRPACDFGGPITMRPPGPLVRCVSDVPRRPQEVQPPDAKSRTLTPPEPQDSAEVRHRPVVDPCPKPAPPIRQQ